MTDMLSRMGEQLQTRLADGPSADWNPPYCGELDVRIAADGRWFYQGAPITREPLIRLFASVLRLESDGRHYLVTPVEKVAIQVEDAPFVSHDLEIVGSGPHQEVWLETNTGDRLLLSAEHALEVRHSICGEPRPYVHVRQGLQALLQRTHFYWLADRACSQHPGADGPLGIYSGGCFFALESHHQE